MSDYAQKKRLGVALRRYVLNKSPGKKYRDVFGCDVEFLRRFLEFQFWGQMGWHNYGHKWRILHVLPLYLFTNEDMALCWNWMNLYPVCVFQISRYSFCDAAIEFKARVAVFGDNPVAQELITKAEALERWHKPFKIDWTKFDKQETPSVEV